MTTTLKTCFKCGETKKVAEFYAHPMMGDGHLNKCKSCTRADVRKNYRQNIQHYREYEKKRGWRPPSPEKLKARNAARVLKKEPCEVCGEIKAEAHHEDYSKPLEVKWLCKRHHSERHTRTE